MPKVLIAGASKGVGFKLAKYLREKGVDVVAMLRSDDAKAKLEGIGAAVVKADALDGGAVRVAFSDAGSNDAVACTVGGKPGDTARADYPGAKNCIDAAKAAGIERFLLVSSIGAGDTRRFLPPPLLERLGPVIDEKDKAEAYLRESGLKYTIVRPGGLESDSATGNGILTEPRRGGPVVGALPALRQRRRPHLHRRRQGQGAQPGRLRNRRVVLAARGAGPYSAASRAAAVAVAIRPTTSAVERTSPKVAQKEARDA